MDRAQEHSARRRAVIAPVPDAANGNGQPRASAHARTFNEAAHKLDATPGRRERKVDPEAEARKAALLRSKDESRDVVAHAGRIALAVGALGVVYGDLGTSPLYTVQTIFSQHPKAATTTVAGVYGIVSLIFWALMIEVSFKYAGFIMRAHNRGDGGIMALAAIIQRRKVAHGVFLVILGIFGAGLFFGDGMITPAISVISSVEGLNVFDPSLAHLVVPIALGIMVALFGLQRFGTGAVGVLFGPVILFFFLVIAIFGGKQVVAHPEVLQGLSPVWGVRFMINHGGAAFLTLGAVVLCVTGAEALYADRGHFGAGAIRFSWFFIVLPAVLLSYLGQSALILHGYKNVSDPNFNPFFALVPHSLLIPMVILATMATIIASQAAITGSYSVAKQAMQLGFLPRLRIRHTSEQEGQIYVPVINWFLAIGVVALILGFQHSAKLADIYGVAVTGTFILNTILFMAVARSLWRTPRWRLAIVGGVFLIVECAFFSSNLSKVQHGAWMPLAVGLLIAAVMITWRRGQVVVTHNRIAQEGPLEEFLCELAERRPPLPRAPGTGIFLSPGKDTTPLAMRAEVEHAGLLQEHIVIVTLDPLSVPHVDDEDLFEVVLLGRGMVKALHVSVRVGYRDRVAIPEALALARKQGHLPKNLDLEHASYFVSRIYISEGKDKCMAPWRKRMFIAMARNAASPIEHFGLPTERTVTMGSQIAL